LGTFFDLATLFFLFFFCYFNTIKHNVYSITKGRLAASQEHVWLDIWVVSNQFV
jgi:hypothetical protein